MNKYDGIVEEILYYSERSDDGRWIIPIEVDWDYTLTKCSSWEQGTMELNDEGFEVMRRWTKEYNVGWILNSMRRNELLEKPIEILKENGITLYGIRKNPRQVDDELHKEVTKSFAVFCIDDRNINCPHQWLEGCNRPHVDWKKIDVSMRPIMEYISKQLKKVDV